MQLHRSQGEVIYGSSLVPRPDLFRDSAEYKELAKALKGKKRTAVMVERFGGKKAWDTFEVELARKLPSSSTGESDFVD